jgi:predicted transcriptional regulator
MQERISFRLDDADSQKLRKMARDRKTTMTAIVKEALRDQWKRVCGQAEISAPPGA